MLSFLVDVLILTGVYALVHRFSQHALVHCREDIRAALGITLTNFRFEASATNKLRVRHVLASHAVFFLWSIKPLIYTAIYAVTYRFVDVRQISEVVFVYNLMSAFGAVEKLQLDADPVLLALRLADLLYIACTYGSKHAAIPLAARLVYDAQFLRPCLLDLLYTHEALIVNSTYVGETLRWLTDRSLQRKRLFRRLHTAAFAGVLLWCLHPSTVMSAGVVASYFFTLLVLAERLSAERLSSNP